MIVTQKDIDELVLLSKELDRCAHEVRKTLEDDILDREAVSRASKALEEARGKYNNKLYSMFAR